MPQSLDVKAAVPGLHSLPVAEVHVDVGAYKIVHLVALLTEESDVKKRQCRQNINQILQSVSRLTSDVSHRNLLPLTKLPIVM